jgi:hypothetical protein
MLNLELDLILIFVNVRFLLLVLEALKQNISLV